MDKRKPSLKERLKKVVGISQKVSRKSKDWRLDIHQTEGDEIDIADENGNIKHIALNVALLKKYQNPYKILYLWSVQENLEVTALTECI